MTLEELEAFSANYFASSPLLRRGGRVASISPHFYRAEGLERYVRIGDVVYSERAGVADFGEVIQIDRKDVLIAPFKATGAIRLGDHVFVEDTKIRKPNANWLGRVLNALGEPMDGRPAPLQSSDQMQEVGPSMSALARDRVQAGFRTGVRAIDVFAPLCYGQRLGIFAGSGVGKSTLLSMLAKSGAFDAVVIALVGERGREVREFVEDALGPEAMKKTVAIVATSDESALMRRSAPELAMQVAETFRAAGKRVLLLVDSATRYAHALREMRISAGEPPVARGYPASVFTDLPKLLERAGPGSSGGSITALFSVLVDGDDHNDPVADAMRGYLDGHIVLDRAIANQGRYPPVDPVASLSRLAINAWRPEEQKLVMQLKAMIARYEDTRDLRLLGGWQPGADEALDRAVATVPLIYDALCQSPADAASIDPFGEVLSYLKERQVKDAAA
jgi:flagellum-specific ATP synthase